MLVDPPLWLFVTALLCVAVVLRLFLARDVLFTLVAGMLGAFVLAEGACRWVGLGSPAVAHWDEHKATAGMQSPYEPDTKLVYTYPDNPRGYFDEHNQVQGTINSQGYRGRRIDLQRQEGIKRLLFLGDSFVLGIGVRDEHTLPALVEQRYHKKGYVVETINMAYSGSSTAKQLDIYQGYGLAYQPDVVVLGVFLNDARRRGIHEFLVYGHVLAQVRQYSWFLNALVGSIEKGMLHRQMLAHYLAGYTPESPEWQAMQRQLKALQALALENGQRLVIALYPVLFGMQADYPFEQIHQTITGFCREQGLPLVDFLDVYRGRDERLLWVHPTDHHPNEEAQALAADYLVDFLIADSIGRAGNPGGITGLQ